MPKQKITKEQKLMIREILEFIVIFAAAFLFYQAIGFALQTPTPMVSVVSESMLPTLHVGDLVIVAKGDYKVGDIVVYMRGNMPIIHRIIEIKNGEYVIKGDNNAVADPGNVKQIQILGKAIGAAPLLGYPRLVLYWFGI